MTYPGSKTGSLTGGVAAWGGSLATATFICQHQPPPRVTCSMMRMVQLDSLSSQLGLPTPLPLQGMLLQMSLL